MMIVMSEPIKNEVNKLRSQGLGYKAIANKLSMSVNTIKSYCQRHKVGIKLPVANSSDENLHFCKCCGVAIEQRKGFKPRKFCSDDCRKEYWGEHQDRIKRITAIKHKCPTCNKIFMDYAKHNRKFCSHECYIMKRFNKCIFL